MKPEEAINTLKGFVISLTQYCDVSDKSSAVRVYRESIGALEKQIPKKAIRCGENPDGTYQSKCSECGRLWWEESYITRYCDSCGQAIDWEGEG